MTAKRETEDGKSKWPVFLRTIILLTFKGLFFKAYVFKAYVSEDDDDEDF